ncbi:MAG: hypothetical protein ABI548_06405 [Polyangiaceae bacterium]
MEGAPTAAPACASSACLIDLVTHSVTPLADAGFGGFDPTSHYFVLGNALYGTEPLRRISELP